MGRKMPRKYAELIISAQAWKGQAASDVNVTSQVPYCGTDECHVAASLQVPQDPISANLRSKKRGNVPNLCREVSENPLH